MTVQDIERLFTLNAIASAELTRQVVPSMIDRGRGHILNVSSLAGCAALPGTAVYSATKAALMHCTSGLRADLEGLSIGTTVVEVSVVPDTEMGESVMGYAPSRDSWRRPKRLRLVSDVSSQKLCRAIVGAIQHDRRHARLPHRTAPHRTALNAILAELPRRNTALLTAGVPPRV